MRTVFSLRCTIWLAVALVSGCTTYHPKPLPSTPDLAGPPAVTMPVSRLDVPGLEPHPLDPTNGLDETTVATLAVINNPELKAARLQAGVANAQALEAGLLPDPVVSGGLSRSTLHSGYGIGLSEDIQALITRGAAKAAAKAHEREVNLQILWQEWQVTEKARELFSQMHASAQLQLVLRTNRELLAERCRQDQAALKGNNLTASIVSADYAALADANTQLRQLEIEINNTRHALNLLLGLKPEVDLRLAAPNETRLLSSEQFRAAVDALPHRRADLLALRAGYESQEQQLRQAVLAQFPSMSAGVQQARDAVEGVNTVGLSVNVTLPLFNRNRGQIAIQKATRAGLYQTYQARINQAVSEADQLWQATRIMAGQLSAMEARLPALEKAEAGAERILEEGNLTLETYVTLKSSFLSEQSNAIRLRASLEQAQSALQTVLGLPLDPAPARD